MILIWLLMPCKRTLLIGPVTRDSGRGDRDTTLTLLLHPVGDGATLVHFAHLVDDARIK